MNYLEQLCERLDTGLIRSDEECIKTISLNITDGCQLSCSYCPHGQGFKGDIKHIMDPELFPVIRKRLEELPNKPRVTISGMGEPMLHPYLLELLEELKEFKPEIMTNGFYVPSWPGKVKELAGRIIVSVHDMADLPHLKSHWPNAVFRNHDITSSDCELHVTNRAGWSMEQQADKEIYQGVCYCPFYKIVIDYDGSYLLCADDWARESKDYWYNVTTVSIRDYFVNGRMGIRKHMLEDGKSSLSPCRWCNIQGTLMGKREADWFRNGRKRYGC